LKKAILFFAIIAFIGAGTALVTAKTLDDELYATGQYLNSIDAKLNDLKKQSPTATNMEKGKKLRAEKNATIAKLKKLKAEKTPPAPAEKIIIEKQKEVVLVPMQKKGSFGWGLLTDVSVGYLGGNSVTVIRANWVIPSLFHPRIDYRLGLGYLTGSDLLNQSFRTIPVYVGGTISLPLNLPFETYVAGGLNFVVYGSQQKSGSLGGDISVGARGNIGLGQKSFIDIGWSGVHDSGNYSARGLAVNVGTQWMF